MRLRFCPNCGGPLTKKAPEKEKPSLVFYNCSNCHRSWFILAFEELVEQKAIVA